MARAKSARGLFKATGKKPKPVAVRLEDGSYAKAPHRERSEDDFDKTPPEATRAFVHAEFDRLSDFPGIWEPACGDGAMVLEMEQAGFAVFSSDLVDRGFAWHGMQQSFYDFVGAPHKAIVTNPPFMECSWGLSQARWLKHALDTLNVEYMALLLPLTWPAAAGMRAFYALHRPARVYLIAWRLDFTGQGAQPATHAFYVWDKKHEGETAMRILYKGADVRQGALFGEAG